MYLGQVCWVVASALLKCRVKCLHGNAKEICPPFPQRPVAHQNVCWWNYIARYGVLVESMFMFVGLSLEGLFRVPGNSNVIQEICKSYEEGASSVHIHTLTTRRRDRSERNEYWGHLRRLQEVHPRLAIAPPQGRHERAYHGEAAGACYGMYARAMLIGWLADSNPHEQLFLLKIVVSHLSIFRRALAFEFFYLLYLVSLRAAKVISEFGDAWRLEFDDRD